MQDPQDQTPGDGGDSRPRRPEQTRRRTGGRIRSEDAHEQTLLATAALLEEIGYGRLTIEGVAARAGVAKSTVYRWWKSKAALVMDAYGLAVTQRMPEPDSGDCAEDLRIFVRQLYSVVEHPTRAEALRGLMAEAQLDPEFAPRFTEWVRSRRQVVAALLARGAARGELAADLDLEHAVDLVFGPFWYRLLARHLPLDPADASAHVDRLLAGLRAS
ncbi:TetR/AcrR family transcriptional regulator [Kitasatospora viridis]|uniref:TetR family transcriptional regulator n=1 Tax=Kitasatospora viridis TaxID=281105 RepID=A0A561ULP2_9ACTN|nr:TetR/AcrR family transcriptional regulator [Kitasatospora viridis]TWG00301.1 TetR family transcriptional regulator [Kitasatospora viridis]